MAEPLNPNRVIALNLWTERRARGWSWDQVSERLAEHGVKWEKATYYAAEASRSPDKPARRFSADELIALALIFHRPVAWFLTPPKGVTMALNEEPLYLKELLELGLQRDLPDLRPLAERLREVATAIEVFEEERQPAPHQYAGEGGKELLDAHFNEVIDPDTEAVEGEKKGPA